ncbi:hypothetical protein L209DRAFT_516295 [Thermothelomyces heterothallicus CBS 203.75]
MVRVGLESFPGAGVPFEGIRHRVFDFDDELLVIFLVHVGLIVFKPHVGFVGHLGDEGFEVVENIGAELAQAPALSSLDKAGRADIEFVVGFTAGRGSQIHRHVPLTDPRATRRAQDIVRSKAAARATGGGSWWRSQRYYYYSSIGTRARDQAST